MATVELAFSPLPVHVRTARLIVTAVARRSGVEEELLDEVRLAVGEACSRAVEAHRMHCPDRPVRLELRDDNGRFEVVVNDTASNGKPVDTEAADKAPADHEPADTEATEAEARAAPPSGGPEAVSSAGAAGGEVLPGDAVPGAAAEAARAAEAAETAEAAEANGVAGAPVGDDPDSLGLAVISGLVDDVEIAPTPDGTQIRMGWPVATNGKR